ncbi:Pyruvate/Phosphoenolpyruvate kinase-like domain-containing protein [Zopfochytrium polystomum]|nr:Pyruvate/Phosphoenolpyruvate kinase-like domain-containing protein [Zopfochytrium polystomum]
MSYAPAGARIASVTTPSTVGMAATNRIRQSLANGGVSVGAWIMLPGTTVARTMAMLGFDSAVCCAYTTSSLSPPRSAKPPALLLLTTNDKLTPTKQTNQTQQIAYHPTQWLIVDSEHGNIQDADLHDTVNAVAPWGPSPLIRLPAGTDFHIKRALDTGAHGIMVPMVNTKEYAERIVQYSKFPPMGIRGHGGPFPAAAWKTTMDDYNKNSNANTFIIVQIETVEAVENADAIASVPGIDMLFVGPNDLAASMGLPPTSEDNSPIMLQALERIKEAAKKHGKYAGIWASDGPMAARRIEQGFQMVSVGADVMAIQGFYGQHLAGLDKYTSGAAQRA